MGESCAWVTLATNDTYCLGALVLAHSLKRASTAHSLVILVTPQVTPIMKERLTQVFKEVISVDVLDSGDAAHLALLARPELGITFTKLHCWSLTQYSKCVFLDADTLVLQNCDELFEREELSAAPDVGWPDCFNSGVFVYRPSSETFSSLIAYAKEKGSFDGGDQGLLNQYFSSWATGDISKHLPFLYNVCSTSFYSYLPALKQFGSNMKIVHFIGALKPWLQSYNWSSGSVNDSSSLQAPLQDWWDIFVQHVHPVLDVAMAGVAGALSQLTLGSSSQCSAVEEHLRRQGWEAGNIDYMGADAFDNIWAKISQTLTGPADPAEQPAPVVAEEAAPIVAEKPAPVVAAAPAPVVAEPAPAPAPVVAEEPAPAPATPAIEPVVQAAPVEVPLTQVPSEAVSTSILELEVSVESLGIVAPPSSVESSVTSSDSTASSVSAPSVVSTGKEPQATAEEKGDNKQVEAGSGEAPPPVVSAPLPKQMEKLVCHLKPAFEVDQLLTPESEHEDAATIAQSIIASEEALLSPVITSATPPASSSPIAPTLPQNVRDLSVDTAIPETPPVPALVSLAQIGILPSKQPEPEVQPKAPEPIVAESELQTKTPEPEPVIAEPELLPKSPEPVVPEPEQPKTPEPVIAAEPELQPKTPEPEPVIAEPELQPKIPEPELQPKTPEPVIAKPKLQPKTPEPEPIAEPKLPLKTPEPEPIAEPKSQPQTPEPELVLADPPKPTVKLVKKKIIKKVPKTPEPTDAAELPETKILVEIKSKAPKTPDAEPEHKLVCSIKTKEIPAQTVAEIVIPDDLENIKPIKLHKTPVKKTMDISEKSDLVSQKPIVEVDKKPAPEEPVSCQIKLKAVPKKIVTDATPKVDISLKGDDVKGEEPSTPATPGEEAPAKPKVKKLVKKVPAAPKVKVEGEGEGADAPVPPPRKKIVKPKEKI